MRIRKSIRNEGIILIFYKQLSKAQIFVVILRHEREKETTLDLAVMLLYRSACAFRIHVAVAAEYPV